MGAKIDGIGTSTLRIQGVKRLHGAKHRVVADRIEAGTYAIAAAMAGGDVTLEGAEAETLDAALSVLRAAGANVETSPGRIRITRNGEPLQATNVVTQVFPGFPTDLQAQFMALMTIAQGESEITETIFENRFMHVQELVRLGADIHLHGDTAEVRGVQKLTGADVMATDLRASVSLVIAGLVAEGETMIHRVYHLDRGFEALEEKLQGCGADVERLAGN
jgi:UDP-N-acetylglucosamine 1-carboxyvinyltransferase